LKQTAHQRDYRTLRFLGPSHGPKTVRGFGRDTTSGILDVDVKALLLPPFRPLELVRGDGLE